MGQLSAGAFWTLWKAIRAAPSRFAPTSQHVGTTRTPRAACSTTSSRWDSSTRGAASRNRCLLRRHHHRRRHNLLPPPPPPPPPPPGDQDKDGVTDDKDQCPNTPAGVAVDAVGCPQKGSITLEGVTFDYNSATLAASSMAVLESTAEGLKKYPRLKVELQGHTDSKGPDAYNLTLSQKRADAVRNYLLKAGVPSTQMTARVTAKVSPSPTTTRKKGVRRTVASSCSSCPIRATST